MELRRLSHWEWGLGRGIPTMVSLSSNSPVTRLPRLGERGGLCGGVSGGSTGLPRSGSSQDPATHAPCPSTNLPEGSTSEAQAPGIEGLEEPWGHLGRPSRPGPHQPPRTHPACLGAARTWEHAPFLAQAGLSSMRPSHPSMSLSCTVQGMCLPSWL